MIVLLVYLPSMFPFWFRVSQDVEVSEDEDHNNEDAYDDSFIDDRINHTEASTETEKDGDMMAIYR